MNTLNTKYQLLNKSFTLHLGQAVFYIKGPYLKAIYPCQLPHSPSYRIGFEDQPSRFRSQPVIM